MGDDPPRCSRTGARRHGWLWPPSLASACLLAACAGLDSERHLAPLYTRLSPAGGEWVETESLGGIVLTQREVDTGRLRYWAVRPIASQRVIGPERRFMWFLPPLGSYRVTPQERVWQLLPLLRFSWAVDAEGETTWRFLFILGVYWAKTDDGRIVRAWFPFGGVVEHFLSFDRVDFVLWPLYMRTQRNGRTTWHFLFPLFSVSRGAGGPAWRFWPLIGHNRWEGRYDRWFALWPLFHWQRDHLDDPPERQGRAFALMPLYGRRTDGTLHSTTFLWPFFGYARDPATGFWAWDGPWPFVRFREPGTTGGATRRRVWPIASYYEGDGLTSRWLLWPFINFRRAVYADKTVERQLLLPFWRSRQETFADGSHTDFRKLWPLFHASEGEHEHSFAILSLNPVWQVAFIEEHYAWIWELYAERSDHGRRRERGWLGLWRREKDRDEDRRSFVGLWARRDYSLGGERVTETSWAFGLLRFRRREGRGLEWLQPAMPGPGWPLQRVPSSILPAEEGRAEP